MPLHVDKSADEMLRRSRLSLVIFSFPNSSFLLSPKQYNILRDIMKQQRCNAVWAQVRRGVNRSSTADTIIVLSLALLYWSFHLVRVAEFVIFPTFNTSRFPFRQLNYCHEWLV